MKYDRHLHDWKHAVKALLGSCEYFSGGLRKKPGELLVLNYHSTPAKFMDEFAWQLSFLETRFEFIAPSELEKYYAGELTGGPYALLTFDDGLLNNFRAAGLLAQRKLKAIFFIVPGFVDTPPERQPDYYRSNIRPLVNERIDGMPEDVSAMSWEQLRTLVAQGHALGSHSYTHLLVSGKQTAEERRREIVDSQTRIAAMTGSPVDAFCGPNNSLLSCGPEEMKLIRENYRYFFSTFPGTNAGESPLLIRRANIESFWLRGAFYRAIGNWDLGRWEPRIRAFAQGAVQGR